MENRELNISKLEIGDVILEYTPFNKRKLVAYLSAGIRLITSSYYNHTLYVSGRKDGQVQIQESVEKGVEIVPDIRKRLEGRDILILKLQTPLDLDEKREWSRIAKNLDKVKYDYWGTLFFQLVYWLTKRWFGGIWLGPKDTSETSVKYCSEAWGFLVYSVRKYIRKPWKLAPAHITNLNFLYPYYSSDNCKLSDDD